MYLRPTSTSHEPDVTVRDGLQFVRFDVSATTLQYMGNPREAKTTFMQRLRPGDTILELCNHLRGERH